MRVVATLLVSLTLLTASTAAVGVRWAWQTLNEPAGGSTTDERVVVVEPGQTGRQIIDDLSAEGVLRQPGLARLYLRLAREGESLKAGEYRLNTAMSPIEVLETLFEARVLTRHSFFH